MIENEKKLYETRIDVFIKRLQRLFYEDRIDLKVTISPSGKGTSFKDRLKGTYQPVDKNQVWGENWERAWFHVSGVVPEQWKSRHVVSRIHTGGESLVFDTKGSPVSGLSIHTLWPLYEFWRDRIDVTTEAEGNEKVEYWIEGSAGEIFGVPMNQDDGDQAPVRYGLYRARFHYAELAVFRKDIWNLYLDFHVLSGLMKALPEDSVRKKRILKTLNRAIDTFQNTLAGVDQARRIVQTELAKKTSDSDLATLAVGHAHIDTAWLWPLDETIRKCARTFSSQVALIEKYPGYVFGASQPQHYVFVKEHYPDLYQRIKQKVEEGTWELQGGMWVEADCNLISGESMIRQIMHGKRFFMDEFGVEVKNLWLPDVFGYSAAMPQILRKSGIDFFVTQKISWNQFNRFPHHTFVWVGLDGSEVITHFPPEDNYNSEIRPDSLIKARNNFSESDFLNEFLTLFGIGDGGSGPTEEMIESAIRQKDLERCPRVTFGHAQSMLDRIVKNRDELPLWCGELYLELHRGTLTTQAYSKMMNRFLEHKLRETEFLYALLPLAEYPAGQLDHIWKAILLHQFHDIIPGSGITTVYEESRLVYEALRLECQNLIGNAGARLLSKDQDKITLFNTLSTTYSRPIGISGEWLGSALEDDAGNFILVQREDDTGIILIDLPPLSATVLHRREKIDVPDKPIPAKPYVLENEMIRYEFDEQGTIARIFDRECNKDVLTATGKGNLFTIYEDRPTNWDAWDIEIYYERQFLGNATLTSRKWLTNGILRQGIAQEFTIGQSVIRQKIYLAANSKRIDFETEVEWNETHKMLRVAFEVNVFSDTATYEIQYGHVKRPTHRNTSWDKAKFEVVAHRFADLSDLEYGVALLNDCKYGHKIYKNILDLNLLRSPTNPDPTADRGVHRFTFSLLPHRGEFVNSDVLREAAGLNQAPVLFEEMDGSSLKMPFSFNSGQVVLEVFKKAETEDALVLRFYESKGINTTEELFIHKKIHALFETDLLERNIHPLTTRESRVSLNFKPFEIKTIKLVLAEH